MKNTFINVLILIVIVVLQAACNRLFDVPPANADPEIAVTMTISALKSRYTAIGDFKRIEDDQVLTGIVIADDRSGNFYKQIIIQDETGGIPILLDGNNVYTMYPVGRRVFIKLRGMMLGDYGGTIQIGIDSSRSDDGRFLNLDGIPQAMFDQYIVKGSFNNIVSPKTVALSDFTKNINDPLLSTLVRIQNAEFRDADINKTYADPSTKVSAVSFTINTCEKKSIVLRNSSYARFAGFNVPDGNGVLTGVPSIFNGTIQMFIRDTGDVKFTGTQRCNTPTRKTIAELKSYASGDSSIPSGVFISGVVVSDTKNEAAGNYRIQDTTGGIQIRFASAAGNPDAVLGDSLMVMVGGLALSQFNGGLQVNNVEGATKQGVGRPGSRIATIAQIMANSREWESTVVTLNDVTIAVGSSTGSGTNYTITDATGRLNTFLRNTAGIALPASAASLTGYVSLFQGAGSVPEAQITLRNQNDIAGGIGGAFQAVFDFAAVSSTSGHVDPTALPLIEGLGFASFTAVGVGGNSSAAGRFSFSGWPTGASNGQDHFTGSIDQAKYYEVTITPLPGRTMDITRISFTLQRSGTGVRQVCVRSGLDGYLSDLPAAIIPNNMNLSVIQNHIFQITDAVTTAQDGCTIVPGNGHNNLNVPVSFRFYGFNAESNGTFSIDNVRIEGMVK